MVFRGGTLLLDQGRIAISGDDLVFPCEHNYGDNVSFIKLFILSYVKFLEDSPLERSGSKKPMRTYYKFLSRLTSTHVADTIKTFSSYANELLQSEYSHGADSTTGIYHEFFRDTPIYFEYHRWYVTRDPDLLRYILSFLLFGKKLEFVSPDFDTTAFRGWLEVEERLHDLAFHSDDVDIITDIIRGLLGPLTVDKILPRFGPGRVAERGVGDVYDKLSSLDVHSRVSHAFTSVFVKDVEMDPNKVLNSRTGGLDVSRLKFVPKDITKSRSICMEPNGYMYFQQEVLRYMRNSMECSLISQFVDMSDQSPNQLAAIHGSTYGSCDTLDLSSASDSVHVDLVRKCFPRDWWYFMLATRTSKVELPDGSVRPIKKFAPMGSAVCFPTQCIIFSAIVLYAYMMHQQGHAIGDAPSQGVRSLARDVSSFVKRSIHGSWTSDTPFTGRFEKLAVFGDDIICDSKATRHVISILQRLGFLVNENKSFIGTQSFRESCGVYAYEGQDVTPVQFRLPYHKVGKWDAQVYSSFIGAINKFGDHGYNRVSSFWLSILRDHPSIGRIPFVEDRTRFGIYTVKKHGIPDRFKRFDPHIQVWFEVVQGIGPRRVKKKTPDNLDSYRLDQWYRSRISEDAVLPFGRSLLVRPQETRLQAVWSRLE